MPLPMLILVLVIDIPRDQIALNTYIHISGNLVSKQNHTYFIIIFMLNLKK